MKPVKYLPSSPYLFKKIKISSIIFIITLLAFSYLLPTKVGLMAVESKTPNPAKASWFLLWIQELVGYSSYLVYFIILLAVIFLCLPYLSKPIDRAKWFPNDQLLINLITVFIILGIIVFSIIAMFRGENWQLKGF